MLITLETANYLDRVTRAIDSGKGEIPLTDRCPECGDKVDTWISAADPNDAHVTYQVTSDSYAVLIGCEGYWVVDPSLVGLPRGMWQDWQDNPLGDERVARVTPDCTGEPSADDDLVNGDMSNL